MKSFYFLKLISYFYNKSLVASIFLILVIVSSCVSLGKDLYFDPKSIQINQTSKVDISEEFGRPNEKGSSSGVEYWRYHYIRFDLFKPATRKELIFYFNSNNTVSKFNWSESSKNQKSVKKSDSNINFK